MILTYQFYKNSCMRNNRDKIVVTVNRDKKNYKEKNII